MVIWKIVQLTDELMCWEPQFILYKIYFINYRFGLDLLIWIKWTCWHYSTRFGSILIQFKLRRGFFFCRSTLRIPNKSQHTFSRTSPTRTLLTRKVLELTRKEQQIMKLYQLEHWIDFLVSSRTFDVRPFVVFSLPVRPIKFVNF